MKKILAIALLALLVSCGGEQKEHRYMVVCNNKQDTSFVTAKYWRTYTDSRPIGGRKSVTEFTSSSGNSVVYDVDRIIALDSTNTNK